MPLSPNADKRLNGRFYTSFNPFDHPAFLEWAAECDLPGQRILEPFAGANGLVRHLQEMRLCKESRSYDITPAVPDVTERDTLKRFPTGFDVCVTNPPWLAKYSATRQGLPFPDCRHDNLYKLALDKCLTHCRWVAALVPESYIRAGLFRDRLRHFVSITSSLFLDTAQPAGLALFGPESRSDSIVWSGPERIGSLARIEALKPAPVRGGPRVRFNDSGGNVGLFAFDNNRHASIRFCAAAELSGYDIKRSSRYITKIQFDGPIRLDAWNEYLAEFRVATRDVLLTSAKGLRKDGRYRRRLDWDLARGIMQRVEAPADARPQPTLFDGRPDAEPPMDLGHGI